MISSHRTRTRPGRNYAILSCALLLTAALVSVVSSRPAASQQNSPAAPKPAGTEIAPRGQREVNDIAYGDWKKLCFKPGAAKMICRTSIAGTFATGQMAVRVDIVEREGDGNARLQGSPRSACICRSRSSLRSTKASPIACLIPGASPTPASRAPWQTRRWSRKWHPGKHCDCNSWIQPPDAHDVAAALAVRLRAQGRAGANV